VKEVGVSVSRLRPDHYLALDLGDRRVGIAAGCSASGLARPLEVFDRTADRLDVVLTPLGQGCAFLSGVTHRVVVQLLVEGVSGGDGYAGR